MKYYYLLIIGWFRLLRWKIKRLKEFCKMYRVYCAHMNKSLVIGLIKINKKLNDE